MPFHCAIQQGMLELQRKRERKRKKEEDVCNKCADPRTHEGVCLGEEV